VFASRTSKILLLIRLSGKIICDMTIYAADPIPLIAVII
jgi:hypothetical protein